MEFRSWNIYRNKPETISLDGLILRWNYFPSLLIIQEFTKSGSSASSRVINVAGDGSDFASEARQQDKCVLHVSIWQKSKIKSVVHSMYSVYRWKPYQIELRIGRNQNNLYCCVLLFIFEDFSLQAAVQVLSLHKDLR